ncbi:hypothetical protein [Spirosoma montaniterrae]|uniref:Uncharacterized protein n=1 Tax=Spirosoma montaniterrae TaxID=1178516 RepID=A0A1P9WYN4_9BACT|nr:hypothetical protein [Spirosoma montaniterrae]AQG80490.1 hypothetical protein AWR27_14865 [Spirosoma montaniterrae]
MRISILTVAIVFCLIFSGQLWAQGLVDGFMRGQRKASLALTASTESFDTYYVGTTETRNPNLGTVTTQSLNAYGVYGLGYDLDLIVNASYVRAEASAGYWPKQEGLQDLSAALRWEAYDYKLGKARLSWLFAVGYSLPLQNYVTDALVTIGRGSRNFDGRTMLHFTSGAFFLTGQYGYIRRGPVTLDRIVSYYDPAQLNPNTGYKVNVPDVTEFVLRGGVSAKRFYVDGWFQQQTPYSSGTDIGPGIPFPTNAVGFTRAGANAYLRLIGKLGLTAGYSTTLSGQNIGKASRVSGGLVIGI